MPKPTFIILRRPVAGLCKTRMRFMSGGYGWGALEKARHFPTLEAAKKHLRGRPGEIVPALAIPL